MLRWVFGVEFDGFKDIILIVVYVVVFVRRVMDIYVDVDGGVLWNVEFGVYNVICFGDSYILVNFYIGVGSCWIL